jgi:hypothetical protein
MPISSDEITGRKSDPAVSTIFLFFTRCRFERLGRVIKYGT